MFTASVIIEKYLSFFEKNGHQKIPNAPLVPENDPTALFISAGMQPLIPYLLGQPHPLGKRLVGIQGCLRTDDLERVGDKTHHTFFEMLGNWSLADYFKKDAIAWSFEFLTSKKWLGIDKNKIAISVFAGDNDAPFDQESYNFWLRLGIPKNRIAKLPKENNWWGPAGLTGPCGPDTEMFVWTGKENPPEYFDCNNPNWIEIWNDVFMEYTKTKSGKYELLKQKNVDTGMGLERILAVLNGFDDDYQTELYWPIIQKIGEEIFPKFKYSDKNVQSSFRILADHIKAITFLLAEDILPSNEKQGYVAKRLIRRALVKKYRWGQEGNSISTLIPVVVSIYQKRYPKVKKALDLMGVINYEEEKFMRTLTSAFKKWDELRIKKSEGTGPLETRLLGEGVKYRPFTPQEIFEFITSYGLPLDIIRDELGWKGDYKEVEKLLENHRRLSQTASSGMFKGGLADNSEEVTKLHTATHLLHAALRKILGKHVQQKGSNITAERLRFDFSHPAKLTNEQIVQIESLVNKKIKENLPIVSSIMTKDRALKSGAIGFFLEKYGEKVTVYSIGDFSREICGGPHVNFTSKLKSFKIIKQKSLGQNLQRIYAIVGN